MDAQLSKDEIIVLNIIKEYLDKNRDFDKEKFYSLISYRLKMAKININNEGLKRIIKSLIDKNLILEGSKLTKDDILSNEKRRKIYTYISQNPGVYYSKIVKDLNYSNHVVIWHLNMLLKFNFIDRIEFMNHFLYYDTNQGPERAKIRYLISLKPSKKILKYLNNKVEGVGKTKMASDLKIHIETIGKYLEILEEQDIITIERQSKRKLYRLNKDNYLIPEIMDLID